jgi:hypothetical protein
MKGGEKRGIARDGQKELDIWKIIRHEEFYLLG